MCLVECGAFNRNKGKAGSGGSGVKDGKRGGSPWLHMRSAEDRAGPRWTPEGILDAAGDHPVLRSIAGSGFDLDAVRRTDGSATTPKARSTSHAPI
jgi:hypothetical protein